MLSVNDLFEMENLDSNMLEPDFDELENIEYEPDEDIEDYEEFDNDEDDDENNNEGITENEYSNCNEDKEVKDHTQDENMGDTLDFTSSEKTVSDTTTTPSKQESNDSDSLFNQIQTPAYCNSEKNTVNTAEENDSVFEAASESASENNDTEVSCDSLEPEQDNCENCYEDAIKEENNNCSFVFEDKSQSSFKSNSNVNKEEKEGSNCKNKNVQRNQDKECDFKKTQNNDTTTNTELQNTKQFSKNADFVIDERFLCLAKIRAFFTSTDFIKNVSMFVLLLSIIIGLPLLVSTIKTRSDSGSSNNKKGTKAEYTSMEYEDITSVNKIYFADASTQAYANFNEANKSSRFETIDDLTLYLSSNLGSTLSTEKQAVNKYNNGEITLNEFFAILDNCKVITDELNHLLIANKNTYIQHGLEDTYNELSQNVESLIAYGDSVKYNIETLAYEN